MDQPIDHDTERAAAGGRLRDAVLVLVVVMIRWAHPRRSVLVFLIGAQSLGFTVVMLDRPIVAGICLIANLYVWAGLAIRRERRTHAQRIFSGLKVPR